MLLQVQVRGSRTSILEQFNHTQLQSTAIHCIQLRSEWNGRALGVFVYTIYLATWLASWFASWSATCFG